MRDDRQRSASRSSVPDDTMITAARTMLDELARMSEALRRCAKPRLRRPEGDRDNMTDNDVDVHRMHDAGSSLPPLRIERDGDVAVVVFDNPRAYAQNLASGLTLAHAATNLVTTP